MPRLIENEDGHFFEAEEGFVFELNENNFAAHVHRETDYMDRVAIEDPRDEMWWSWWRADTNPEIFEAMLVAAHQIGSILLRTTPLLDIDSKFTAAHQITDMDLDLLRSDDE